MLENSLAPVEPDSRGPPFLRMGVIESLREAHLAAVGADFVTVSFKVDDAPVQ